MLRLQGASHAYQIVPLTGASRFHLLNCVAYKQTVTGDAEPGWAGMGIIYFDALWAVIDRFERQIFVEAPSGPRAIPSLQFGSARASQCRVRYHLGGQ